MWAGDAIAGARNYLGTVEAPRGSNRTVFGQWYGYNGVPWCAIFQSFVLSHIGIPTRHDNCYEWLATAAKLGDVATGPQPGDIAIFSYGSGHCGLVVDVSPSSIATIEGNTDLAGSPTGGAVLAKVRRRDNLVRGYVRPRYGYVAAPRFDPALVLEPIVDWLIDPVAGGTWLLAGSGAIYAVGGARAFAPSGANEQGYFAGRRAAQLQTPRTGDPAGVAYTIVATSGERYSFGHG